jgi:hypothetical protein
VLLFGIIVVTWSDDARHVSPGSDCADSNEDADSVRINNVHLQAVGFIAAFDDVIPKQKANQPSKGTTQVSVTGSSPRLSMLSSIPVAF